MDLGDVALLLAAGLVAGVVNAIAGGGSLVSFPALILVGLPPVSANVTNSVAVTPGYLASVAGSRGELAGQWRRVGQLAVTAGGGALAGGLLLLVSPERAFELLAPLLVLAATALIAFQDRLRRLVASSAAGHDARGRTLLRLHVVVAVAGLYGGYFRPALGVVLIALLALVLEDSMPRLNALKNVGQAVIGVVTVVLFALLGPVDWLAVAVLVPTSIAGGYAGARFAPRLPEAAWKVGIVVFGLVVGVVLLLRAL